MCGCLNVLLVSVDVMIVSVHYIKVHSSVE